MCEAAERQQPRVSEEKADRVGDILCQRTIQINEPSGDQYPNHGCNTSLSKRLGTVEGLRCVVEN